jgi:hypothetical protein
MTTDLDRRLREYHQALVAGFAEEASRLAPGTSATRRSRRLPWLVAAAVVAASAALLVVRLLPSATTQQVTLEVPGFTIVAQAATNATPHLTAEEAKFIALESLSRGATQIHITGFTVTGATFAPDVVSISQTCGAHIGLARVASVWVIGLTAPPQQGWQFIRAAILVDDHTRGIAGGQILTGPDPGGPLSTCHWGT